jgi:hypothetical protein
MLIKKGKTCALLYAMIMTHIEKNTDTLAHIVHTVFFFIILLYCIVKLSYPFGAPGHRTGDESLMTLNFR